MTTDRADAECSPPMTSVSANSRLGIGLWTAWLVVLGALSSAYAGSLLQLAQRWWTDPEYPHGMMVPLFSAFLLWHRRRLFPMLPVSGSGWGWLFLAVAAAMRWISEYFFYPLLDAPSLIPCLAGIALLAGGRPALRW